MNKNERAEFEAWWYELHDETDTGISYQIALNAWLAARRSQDEQVRELVEAVEKIVAAEYYEYGALRNETSDAQDIAAQLKETTDE